MNRIETIEFSDSSSLTSAEILSAALVMHGTESNDVLNGTFDADTIYGNGGDDTINGNDGDDIISGGQGNDTLSGGFGQDTYLFNEGDGQDTINNDAYDSAQDILKLGTGFTSDNIWLTQVNYDLLLQKVGSSDQVRITDWFMFDELKIGQIQTDNSVLHSNQVANLVNEMAAFTAPSGTDGIIPQDVQDQLAPVIESSWIWF